MYVNRFLFGVAGVPLAFDRWFVEGGVRDPDGSVCPEPAETRVFRFGGMACGISSLNNSDLSKVENVRFASSAMNC